MHTASPIIIIGCGRSGSTLLRNILDAHPEVVMFNEFRFSVAKIWDALLDIFRDASAYKILKYIDDHPEVNEEAARSPFLLEKLANQLEPNAAQRRGEIIRNAIAEALYLNERSQSYWGYKEIFNSGEVDWTIYDDVFPQAWWCHIIRNPVDYTRSAIWHTRQQLTDENIIQQLTPLLDVMGIGWHEACRQAVGRQVGAKSERVEMPRHLSSLIGSVPELPRIMEEYDFPRNAPSGSAPPVGFKPARLVRNEYGGWQLCGHVWPEEGLAWQFDLDQTHLGRELASLSDDVDLWQRSPLRLFEGDRPLGPAHALHRVIRDAGGGTYSHWQTRLIFSTSDNSDPNTNGRGYRFALP
jgi:hypothetical protein